MAEEEKKEEGGEEGAGKAPMMSKMGIIVVAVFLLIYTAALVLVLKPSAPPEGEEAEVKTVPKTAVAQGVVKIDAVPITVIVNETTQESKLINVEIAIEVNGDESSEVYNGTTMLIPWIKSQLITIVQSQTFTELMKPEAKEYIKAKIKSGLENKFNMTGNTEFKIIDVWITSFLIAG